MSVLIDVHVDYSLRTCPPRVVGKRGDLGVFITCNDKGIYLVTAARVSIIKIFGLLRKLAVNVKCFQKKKKLAAK